MTKSNWNSWAKRGRITYFPQCRSSFRNLHEWFLSVYTK